MVLQVQRNGPKYGPKRLSADGNGPIPYKVWSIRCLGMTQLSGDQSDIVSKFHLPTQSYDKRVNLTTGMSVYH